MGWRDCFRPSLTKSSLILVVRKLILGPAPQISSSEVAVTINRVEGGKEPDPEELPVGVRKLLWKRAATVLAGVYDQFVKE